jgi:hypothetical protein
MLRGEITVYEHAITRARERWGATGTDKTISLLIRQIARCAEFQNSTHGRDWYALGAFVVLVQAEQDGSFAAVTVKTRVWRDCSRWKNA